MNRLLKNKFFRENLVLLVILALIFPPYAFSDVWVTDTENEQVSRLYREGHAKTVVKVVTVNDDGDTISVNINPTALFYPGLKLSFGKDRANVYEIDSVDSDPNVGWTITFTDSLADTDIAESPIYMELARAGGFTEPVSVSVNESNTRGWFTDTSPESSGVTQITGWGRDEPNDTGIVRPYYNLTNKFEENDTMFYLSSQDTSIYQGIKLDFSSDNRARDLSVADSPYVLEIEDVNRTTLPYYTLTTSSGLPTDHSIIGREASVIHMDRFRDKAPISPGDISCSSNSDENDPEYDIAWIADAGRNSVKKYENWQYRRKLTIDPTDKIVGENLTDFPLCVKLNSSRIDYTKSTGADIRFLDSEGDSLKYEIEKWDETGTSVVWVKVPEVSSTDTTIIYMYYGNPDAQDAQDTENVWDDSYRMVQHLEETDTRIYDSTFNNNDGTSYSNGPPFNLYADGLIDGACKFDASKSDHIEIPDKRNNRLKIDQQITIEAWVKGTAEALSSDTATIVTKGTDTIWTNNNYSVGLNKGQPVFVWGEGSVLAGDSLEPDTWYHLAFVADYPDTSNALRIYVNGELVNEADKSETPIITSEAQLNIGTDDGSTHNFDGVMDEVRISNIARSDTWIKTCFYSENDELITFWDEENVRYAGVLKVGGFSSPQSISVNSSSDILHSGEVWVADTGDSAVVKLAKEGHKTIKAVVTESREKGDIYITLTDVSELDSGINVSFNNNLTDVCKIIDILESETQIVIGPGLHEALRGEPPEFGWGDTPLLLETMSYNASGPQVAMSGDTAVVAVWQHAENAAGTTYNIYSNYSIDAGASWVDTQLISTVEGDARYPQVAMSGNSAVAVWSQYEGTNAKIYYNYLPEGGASWVGAQPLETVEGGNVSPPQLAMSGNNAVAVWQEFDFWATYGTSGSGVGQFQSPRGIYFDSSDSSIYICDSSSSARIVKTDRLDGGTVWETLSNNSPFSDTPLNWSEGVYYDSATKYLYIADGNNDRIVKTNMEGTVWTAYGTTSGPGHFDFPSGIYYDSKTGYVYVSDTLHNRIVKTKLDASFPADWAYLGGFSGPSGIYHDHDSGYTYVCSAWNNRIVKTNRLEVSPGGEWSTLGEFGNGDNQFSSPQGIYFDSSDSSIYVADSGNNRIVKTNILDDGTHWETYGTSGSGVGQFQSPRGIYYDSSTGFIYVSDSQNFRIVKTKMGAKESIISCRSDAYRESWSSDTQILRTTLFPTSDSNPKVAISEDNAVAVWREYDGTTYNIYSSYLTTSAPNWSTPQLLEMADGDAVSPQVAIGGSNKTVAVWQQNEGANANIYYNYSDNGGASWLLSGPLLLETGPDTAISPQVVMSGNNAVAVWSQYEGTTYNIYSNYSTDGGEHWRTAQLIETGSKAAYSPQVAISGKNAVVIWSGRPIFWGGGDIYSNYSTDGGKSWIGAQVITAGSYQWAITSNPRVAISSGKDKNAVAVWQQTDAPYLYSIYSNHTTFDYPPFAIPVGRELARITGFTNPVAVAVDSASGNCWVADSGDTVVWISGNIGYDPTTAGYDIDTDINYHRIITGFDEPVSVAVDSIAEDSGYCWVACEGDTYIVRLDKDVADGYDVSKVANQHKRIYGFNSPSAVSVDPSTGECWVSDKGNNQIVKLSPDGYANSGYTLAYIGRDYVVGDTEIRLEPSGVDADTSLLYPPLKVSFSERSDIEPVYQIDRVESDTIIIEEPGLDTADIPLHSTRRLYQELVRVSGFDLPSDVSAFEGPDLSEGIHPWWLQVRELYVVDTAKYTGEWHIFPHKIPIHDATPQFRWKYIDVDGTGAPLGSYQINIYTLDKGGNNFVEVPNSPITMDVPAGTIYEKGLIRTDWNYQGDTKKENDSTSIYSLAHYSGLPDDDDCMDLSQIFDDDLDVGTGDHTFYVQLTVKNKNGIEDSYPADGNMMADSPIIRFTLDRTPPGSYIVCGTGTQEEKQQVNVPAPDGSNVYDAKYNNIKNKPGNLWDTDVIYYQTNNYYWDDVWVEWDGGNTEIVQEDSPWIDKRDVTVRVKVKDRNNENVDEGTELDHPGHGPNEFPEGDTNCSGISSDVRNAQYRYSLATSAPRVWSDWVDCDEIRLFDEDKADSVGAEMTARDENRNTFVWLYAKNVKLDNGETNLIQFRVQDEGELEVTKIADNGSGDTPVEVWIAPNMGYSHADTIIDSFYNIEYQTSSNVYGYQLQIDTEIPEVILVDYPHNPYPHRFASFRWMSVDTTPCWFKYKLEYWDEANGIWDIVPNSTVADGEDPFDYSNDEDSWNPDFSLPISQGTDATSTSFDGLEVGRWYRFWVKAKDRDGAVCGVGQSPCSRRVSKNVIWVWYVSPEVPDTIITSGPSGQTTNKEPIFTWKAVGGCGRYLYNYWRPDTKDWSNWVSDVSYAPAPLDDGTYIFQVKAANDMDDVGGPEGSDPTPARRIFTVVDPNHPPYSTVSPFRLYKYFGEMGE